MKKLLFSAALLTLISTTSFAQLQDREWLLGGAIGVTTFDNTTFAAPTLFIGKILSERNAIGAGISLQYNGSGDGSSFVNQTYSVEFQRYKNISEEIPLSFFYAPSIFVQSQFSEDTSIGGAFRLGLSYRHGSSWLLQIAPLNVRAQFGTPNAFTLGAGQSNINVVWLFGK